MMERYYDAHLYLANWGTREVMLRVPESVLDLDTVGAYCPDRFLDRLDQRRQHHCRGQPRR
jgi:hypothetical protein